MAWITKDEWSSAYLLLGSNAGGGVDIKGIGKPLQTTSRIQWEDLMFAQKGAQALSLSLSICEETPWLYSKRFCAKDWSSEKSNEYLSCRRSSQNSVSKLSCLITGAAESGLGELESKITETSDLSGFQKDFSGTACWRQSAGAGDGELGFSDSHVQDSLSTSEKEIHSIYTGNRENLTDHSRVGCSISNLGLVRRSEVAIVDQFVVGVLLETK